MPEQMENGSILIWVRIQFGFTFHPLVTFKEVGQRTAKLALFLIEFMKFELVQFLLHEYLEENPNCVYIPNIYLL